MYLNHSPEIEADENRKSGSTSGGDGGFRFLLTRDASFDI
jgi:hypothetical protein